MSKFQKLAKINKIANECVQDGDFVLASKFHNEFMKIAQGPLMPLVPEDTLPKEENMILLSRVAKGMGLSAGVPKEELLANVVRVCDYIKPERLKNPSQPASPNNVMLRSMAGATPENSYSDEYWANCSQSFNNVISPTMIGNFKNKCDYIRKAARAGNVNAVVAQFASA
jgi:hypothetical protein